MILKRIFDFLISSIFSLLLIPFWILTGLIIKLDSKGPIFFRQKRVGKNGDHFFIYKFRTMIINAEEKGLKITVGEKDPRITRMGFLLRKTKLDELPQLFNIVRGEMSLVGPRPEVPKYVYLYNDTQKKVLNVLPGITDLASLEYIDENTLLEKVSEPEKTYINDIMPEKLKLNLRYIENQSFFYDLKIIGLTILKIFTR